MIGGQSRLEFGLLKSNSENENENENEVDFIVGHIHEVLSETFLASLASRYVKSTKSGRCRVCFVSPHEIGQVPILHR